jgi:hypothetical protein
MSPTPIILAALASSCRVLLNNRHLQSAARREVLEFHLQWMDLVHSAGRNGSKTAEFEDLALRMARFVVNHEPSRATKDYRISTR